MDYEIVDFDSPFFTLYRLDDGIFAVIATDHALTGANAGFFDLGDHVILFDTLAAPKAIQDLLRAVQKFISKPLTMVVNSHFHGDHIYGNHAIPSNIPIISNQTTLEMMNKYTLTKLEEYQKVAPTEIETLKTQLEIEENPNKIFEIESDINFLETIISSNFQLRAPDILINDSLIIHGRKRAVHLFNVGAAHSEGDIIAYLPSEKICFMSDLLFENVEPSWAEKETVMPFAVDPINHYKILKEYYDLNLKAAIPGHGKLISPEITFKKNLDYLKLKYKKILKY
jgi:glyoxylase-like metal-dependent hydrolase (beta-lactamase superfamily II)